MDKIKFLTPIDGTMVCDKAGIIENDALLIDITFKASAGRRITVNGLETTDNGGFYTIKFPLTAHFKRSAEALEKAATRNGKYGKYFETRALCSRVLELKATMGYRISEAYKSGNKDTLRKIADEELPEMKRRVAALYNRHRELWYEVYKPFGWEVEDLRYGSLYGVIDSTIFRLNQYLNDEVSALDELTAPRLSFDGGEKLPRTFSYMWSYTSNVYEPRN